MELRQINCPICSCKECKVIGKTRKVDEIFKSTQYMEISSCNVVQCKKCSLLYVNPFPFFSDDLFKQDVFYRKQLFSTVNIKNGQNPSL